MEPKNLYTDLREAPEEVFETLVSSDCVRIERIVSDGHASPEGFWYDQVESEWVLLLKGSAVLRIDGKDEPVFLKPGDWIDIPAHARHRVEWDRPSRKDDLADGLLQSTRRVKLLQSMNRRSRSW